MLVSVAITTECRSQVECLETQDGVPLPRVSSLAEESHLNPSGACC